MTDKPSFTASMDLYHEVTRITDATLRNSINDLLWKSMSFLEQLEIYLAFDNDHGSLALLYKTYGEYTEAVRKASLESFDYNSSEYGNFRGMHITQTIIESFDLSVRAIKENGAPRKLTVFENQEAEVNKTQEIKSKFDLKDYYFTPLKVSYKGPLYGEDNNK